MKKKIIRAVTVDQSLGFVEPLINELKNQYEVQVLSSAGNDINRISKQYDIKAHKIYMYRRLSPLKDLSSLYEIIKVFRNENPYIVHSMTPKAGLLCMLASWLTRVPIRIHTFTGLVWPTEIGLKRKILMFTDWITCACATHVIPEGKGVMTDLQSYITNKPMKVLGYGNVRGVDMERFNPTRFADVKKNDNLFRFIFVGRIVGDKGINELVGAFNRLNKEYPNTQLCLVGKYEEHLDPLQPNTLKTIQENSSIKACGPKYGDELLIEYIKSDCFVMPSYREGFPNTVMEAGAMGLPSIVTDINGSREIIINKKNGLIVPSKNTNALYETMKQLLLDSDTRREMAKNARPLIESRFEKGFVQKCLINFYEDILNKNNDV